MEDYFTHKYEQWWVKGLDPNFELDVKLNNPTEHINKKAELATKYYVL